MKALSFHLPSFLPVGWNASEIGKVCLVFGEEADLDCEKGILDLTDCIGRIEVVFEFTIERELPESIDFFLGRENEKRKQGFCMLILETQLAITDDHDGCCTCLERSLDPVRVRWIDY